MPILAASRQPQQALIALIFEHFVNTKISPAERKLFQTGILCPLAYVSKPTKLRPIVMLDCLLKVAWHIVLSDIKDINIDNSSNTSNRKGACQLAIHAVQEALNAGEAVIALDSVNAFNTLSRQPIFDYLQQHRRTYGKTFHLVNMMYAEKTVCI